MYKAQLTTYTLSLMTAGRRAVSTFINLSHPTVFKLFSLILIKMKAAFVTTFTSSPPIPSNWEGSLLLLSKQRRLLLIIWRIELTIETWSSVIRCFMGFISNKILRTLCRILYQNDQWRTQDIEVVYIL